MKLISVPQAVLRDLIWNAELITAGMNNDAVDRQTAILRSYLPDEVFYPHGNPNPKVNGEVTGLFTGKII